MSVAIIIYFVKLKVWIVGVKYTKQSLTLQKKSVAKFNPLLKNLTSG